MALTSEQLLALNTTLKARWNAGLIAAPNHWEQVAMLINSDSHSNTYGWLSQFPAFREWVGQRLHKAVAETAYTVVNKPWENTIDIPRTAIVDNAFGHYGAIAESYGQSVIDLQNDLIFQALAAGFTTTCYDGQYFFDTDHPVYPSEDGSGVAVSVSNRIAGGTGEPWVLLCANRAAKPLYLQEREKPRFTAMVSPDSPNVFDYDVYSYGGYWRGNAAYGFWQCAHGGKVALDEANFNAAYDAMLKLKGDGGRKLGIVPNLLVVGPDNRAAAEELILAQNKTGGASNTNYKRVELLVSPWMAL